MQACFERSTSTEQSLLLLRQFESLLQRESFRSDLDAKYAAAFQSYAGGSAEAAPARTAGWPGWHAFKRATCL